MLKLPSTTQVNQRLPKEAFYRNLDLGAKQKDEFVQLIECITVVNSVKPSTMNMASGAEVHEVMVLELVLKEPKVPILAIEAIAKTNANKLAFRCVFEENEALVVYRSGKCYGQRLGPPAEDFIPQGANLDELWESICSYVVFESESRVDVAAELARKQKLVALDAEIQKLQRQHAKEKQMAKRNELFKKLKQAKRERDTLAER